MRKDMRLGLAVGAILFAVVLVYVLFAGNGGKGASQQARGGADARDAVIPPAGEAPSDNSSAGMRQSTPAPVEQTRPQIPAPPQAGSTTGQTPAPQHNEPAPPADATPREGFAGGSTGAGGAAAQDSTRVEPGPRVNPPADPVTILPPGGSFDWSRLLSEGAAAGELINRDISRPGAAREGSRDGSASSNPAPGRETQRPFSPRIPGAAREYIVKAGDSLWEIARAEYGNPVYMSHISRANPSAARGLKVGDKLMLPPREEVIPPGADRPETAKALDPAKEYRVRSGDNLHRICEQLYGSPSRWEELYYLNKERIGPNKSALKVNMVLQLPAPPTRNVVGSAQ